MSKLLNLYPTILVPIFVEWVCDLHLCALDTACCNHVIRLSVMNLLMKCSLKNTYLDFTDKMENISKRESYMYYYEWVYIRGITIRRFWLTKKYTLSTVERNLLAKLKYLEYLEAPNGEDLLTILSLCPVVHKLKLNVGTLYFADEDFLGILSNLQSLKALDLNLTHSLTTRSFDALVATFPNLAEFSSLDSDGVAQVVNNCRELRSVTSNYSSDIELAISESTSLQAIDLCSYEKDVNEQHLLKCVESSNSFWKFQVNSNFSRTFFRRLAQCQHLTSLEVRDITDEDLIIISRNCPKLDSIIVDSYLMSCDGLMAIASNCPVLKSYHIYGSERYSDETVVFILSACKALTSFSVYNNNLTDNAGQHAIDHCPTLRELRIVSNNAGFDVVLSNVREAKHLEIISSGHSLVHVFFATGTLDVNKTHVQLGRDYVDLDTECITGIIHQCSQILDVRFEMLFGVNDECIQCLVDCCPLLTSLSLMDCNNITIDGYTAIAGGFPQLTKLVVQQDNPIDDAYMIRFVSARPRLRKLWINYSHITDAALEALSVCSLLRSLDLCNSLGITAQAVITVLQGCPMLSYLDIRSCSFNALPVLQTIEDLRRRMVFLGVGNSNSWDADEYLKGMDPELVISRCSD